MIGKTETSPLIEKMTRQITRSLHRTIPVFMFMAFLITGCATTDEKSDTPAAKLRRGKEYLKAKNYDDAKIVFHEILEDAPDSKERVMALRLLADTFYTDEEYDEAKARYQKFLELYPAHKYAAHAMYFKAMTDFNQIHIASRDQTSTQNALEEFDELIAKFPKSSYAKKAIPKKKECTQTLARNLFEIGEYYYRKDAYQAAIGRFNTLLENYPEQDFIDETLFLLGESYFREQSFKKGRITFIKLIKKYPKSEFAELARERLREMKQG